VSGAIAADPQGDGHLHRMRWGLIPSWAKDASIGRLGVTSVYCRTTDRFDAKRISYAKWKKDRN